MIILETASSTNIWYDIALVGIGIIATLIGGIIMKLLETRFAKHGELAVYYRVINIQQNTITIRIQIKNASHEVKFLRDLCLFRIKNNIEKKLVASDKAAYKIKNEIQEIKFFANEGSYSISAQPRDIKEFELVYISDEYIRVGDEFVLSFYDDKEILIRIPLKAEHNENWIKGYPEKKTNKKK